LDLRVLGPFEAVGDGGPLPLGAKKQRAVLAMLVLEANRPVSADRLAEGLWADSLPPSAGKMVQQHISLLRKVLDGQDVTITTRARGYQLACAPGDVDLARAERLVEAAAERASNGAAREALSLWRGPPLADLADEPFAAPEIRRCEELWLQAKELAIDADLAAGRHEDVLREVIALAADHPLQEHVQAQLMLTLYRSGRQAEALEVFRVTRARLVDEIGSEPGPELRRLHEEMLHQSPSLDAPVRVRTPVARGAAPRAHRRSIVAVAASALALLAVGGAVLLTRSAHQLTPAAIDANVVAVIDPAHASLTAQLPVGASPSDMAVGEGAVWVSNADDQTVSRLDPKTRTVRQTIGVGSAPGAIAAGLGGVWVVNTLDRTLSWISPATNKVVKTITVGNGPSGVCIGDGGVWVANGDDRTVLRIDPRTGRRTRLVRLDDAPTELACGGGAVWASSESGGTVTEIGGASASVTGTTKVGAGASALGFGDGALWVANPLAGTVSRIDPRRGDVVRTVAFGAGDGPAALAVGHGAVWVSNQYAGTIARIDPRRGVVDRKLTIGNRPQGLALVGGQLWTGVRAAGARHRGGTLRLLGVGTPIVQRADLDPAAPAAYGLIASRILGITNDGLTAFRHAGGLKGTKLVPDLAVVLPDATDGGRTYAFKLRSGVRYSDGALVRPGDIRRGLERTLGAGSPGSPLYGSIAGAAACMREPRGCDLSRGIAVDDSAGTVTFHLTAPDPQFLYELALDFAVAVPPGTGPPGSGRPLPSTGPYVLAPGRSRKEVRLVRNPHFHVWSNAAKPDGYPDVIVRQSGVDLAAAVRAVEAGEADYVNLGSAVADLPRAELDALFTRYAGEVHTSSQPTTVFYWLNTREPPFDSLDVRRALNYAVDRRAALALEGGGRFAQTTCQIVPPNFPGYRPYCPYTADAGPGRPWTAPDLPRARRLIARSGTHGMRVTVWGRPEQLGPHSRFLARLLRQLGYDVALRLVPDQRIGGIVADPRRHAQTGPQIWTADFAAASNFLGLTFSCDALVSGDHVGLNWSRFCDTRMRTLTRRAQRLPATEQAGANALWGAIDREVVDKAAAVPLLNPKAIEFISRRTGNAQYNPQGGLLLDQLWVR
jgi:YVTN family beta-propeller protein